MDFMAMILHVLWSEFSEAVNWDELCEMCLSVKLLFLAISVRHCIVLWLVECVIAPLASHSALGWGVWLLLGGSVHVFFFCKESGLLMWQFCKLNLGFLPGAEVSQSMGFSYHPLVKLVKCASGRGKIGGKARGETYFIGGVWSLANQEWRWMGGWVKGIKRYELPVTK